MRGVSSGGSSWAIHTEWVQAASGQVDTGSDMSDSDDEAVEERTCNLAKLAENMPRTIDWHVRGRSGAAHSRSISYPGECPVPTGYIPNSVLAG